jgi:hypothetical protein
MKVTIVHEDQNIHSETQKEHLGFRSQNTHPSEYATEPWDEF